MAGARSRIAILGPGAIGGMLAAIFCRNGVEVTCIAKPDRAVRVSREGIVLHSPVFGDIRAHPRATDRLDIPVDVLFITVKAGGLADGIERIAHEHVRDALIIPLLNGIGHLEPLRATFGPAVVAGTIGAVEVYRDEAGDIVHANGRVRIEMGSDTLDIAARLINVENLLQGCGIGAEVKATEAETAWGKLVRLCPIAATTAAAQRPIGEIRSDAGWRSRLERGVKEAALVSQAEGAHADPTAIMAFIDALPPEQLTSLARDVAKNRRGEADAIIGGVIRHGESHGIPCPTLRDLLRRIDARLAA